MFDDPQVIHNNLIVEWDLPNGETQGDHQPSRRPNPEFRPFIGVVGEYTEQILAELGHDTAGDREPGAGVGA